MNLGNAITRPANCRETEPSQKLYTSIIISLAVHSGSLAQKKLLQSSADPLSPVKQKYNMDLSNPRPRFSKAEHFVGACEDDPPAAYEGRPYSLSSNPNLYSTIRTKTLGGVLSVSESSLV